MMSGAKKRVPKRRFKEFLNAGDWEQRKLGDIATITGGGTPSTNISEYWNGDIDWYSPVEIGENRYVSRSTRKITKLGLEKSSAKILPVGTVLFTSRAGIGNTAILQAEGCTNQGFQSITPNSKELDTYFLYTMTPKLKRYGEVTGAGSTFVEVSGKQMEQMNLMIPSLEEQKHVSQLFELMDDAITLHQHKLDKLQATKKALLQEMFPEEGQDKPKRRFKGFTDSWEQRKLGDLTPLRGGFAFKSTEFKATGVPVIRISNILSDGSIGGDFAYYLEQNNDENYVLPNNALVIAMSGATTGKAAVLKNTGNIKFYQNQRVGYFQNNLKCDYSFISTLVKSSIFLKQLESVLVAGAQPNISSKEIDSFIFKIPISIDEQRKISKLFNMIDSTITLHQRKLDKLKNLKQAYLNEMFV